MNFIRNKRRKNVKSYQDKMKGKRTIVFDFDGVIHRYSEGWKDGSIYDIPTPGIRETINKLSKEYRIIVCSTRCAEPDKLKEMQDWCDRYEIYVDDFSVGKPVASMYVDDRAINFTGNCNKLIKDIRNFEPWTEKYKHTCAYCGKTFYETDPLKQARKYCSNKCKKRNQE